MDRPGQKLGLLPALLLVVFLHTAQFASLLHAFEHEPDALSGTVCSTCATAGQLSTACVDTQGHDELAPSSCRIGFLLDSGYISAHAILVHQRGPPTTP